MASDHMHGMAAEDLLDWILKDLEKGSALGIAKEQFFTPKADDPFRMERYGVRLESPLGVAAGPHTQMAQNIIAAWLTGARYIELKTVQVLDSITVTKPCIDMADEGYNCEWSQELTLDQSYDEYLKAWVLLHVLHDKLIGSGKPGMIFNMSAGYSMEGILSPTVQRFLDRMGNCAADVAEMKKRLAPIYPRIAELDIPGRMSDNLTISCMHGCPPEEVEKIALYFIEQRRYNTTLKMNPTLLGAGCVRGILNGTLGYETEIPDIAFEHDLPYGEAINILNNCIAAAQNVGVAFGVKLTNTLESLNGKQNLPKSEKMLYMSGKALHPISIALAARLQKHFGGALDISFCAGLDSMNIADSLACGIAPLTVCSDLLKPGGYGRLAKYVQSMREAMKAAGAANMDDFILKRAAEGDLKKAMVKNLDSYAEVVTAPGSRYAKKAAKAPKNKDGAQPRLDAAGAPLQVAAAVLECKKTCGICAGVCPNRANWILDVPAAFKSAFGQTQLAFNLGDFCNECGNCATFCPHYLPYRDKVRLHLGAVSYKADNRGFYRESPDLLRAKIDGHEYTLKKQGKGFVFENGKARVSFDLASLPQGAESAPALLAAMVFTALEDNGFAGA